MEIYIVTTQLFDTRREDVISHKGTDITVHSSLASANKEVMKLSNKHDHKHVQKISERLKKLAINETTQMLSYLSGDKFNEYEIYVTKKLMNVKDEILISHNVDGCDLMAGFDPDQELDEEVNEEVDE